MVDGQRFMKLARNSNQKSLKPPTARMNPTVHSHLRQGNPTFWGSYTMAMDDAPCDRTSEQFLVLLRLVDTIHQLSPIAGDQQYSFAKNWCTNTWYTSDLVFSGSPWCTGNLLLVFVKPKLQTTDLENCSMQAGTFQSIIITATIIPRRLPVLLRRCTTAVPVFRSSRVRVDCLRDAKEMGAQQPLSVSCEHQGTPSTYHRLYYSIVW